MRNFAQGWVRRPSTATLLAAAVVVAGFLLTARDWRFLILSGLGAVLPGVLRELGWLRDKDECQQLAAHRAGYHAFLVTGLAAFALVGYLRAVPAAQPRVADVALTLLALLWFTWLFSSLVNYWGARRTAVRVLVIFGTVWLAFNVAANATEPTALLMQVLLTAMPFFALAWVARRWPRVAGVLLIAATLVCLRFFHWFDRGGAQLVNNGAVVILFAGPLAAGGVALLTSRTGREEEADA